MEPVLESINLEDLSYHRRDRGSLSDYQGSVMDRVKNRSETKSNRGYRYVPPVALMSNLYKTFVFIKLSCGVRSRGCICDFYNGLNHTYKMR